MCLPHVLFAERTVPLLQLWERQLDGETQSHKAKSRSEFWARFNASKDALSGIVFGNAFMNGPVENIIRSVRAQGFTGPILVCTCDPDARSRQLQVGGPSTFAIEKDEVAQQLRKMLHLQPKPTPVYVHAANVGIDRT